MMVFMPKIDIKTCVISIYIHVYTIRGSFGDLEERLLNLAINAR